MKIKATLKDGQFIKVEEGEYHWDDTLFVIKSEDGYEAAFPVEDLSLLMAEPVDV